MKHQGGQAVLFLRDDSSVCVIWPIPLSATDSSDTPLQLISLRHRCALAIAGTMAEIPASPMPPAVEYSKFRGTSRWLRIGTASPCSKAAIYRIIFAVGSARHRSDDTRGTLSPGACENVAQSETADAANSSQASAVEGDCHRERSTRYLT